jgi:hypothetical protein
MRTLTIVIGLVICLFIAVPHHYWGALAAVLKATAMCGTSGVMVYRCIRRH